MNDVAKAAPRSRRRMVLVAVERRDDGQIVLHPPSPGERKFSSPMNLYQNVLDLLDDERIPDVESVKDSELAVETAMTNLAAEVLPDSLKPLASQAAQMTKTILKNVGRRPAARAPMGRRR